MTGIWPGNERTAQSHSPILGHSRGGKRQPTTHLEAPQTRAISLWGFQTCVNRKGHPYQRQSWSGFWPGFSSSAEFWRVRHVQNLLIFQWATLGGLRRTLLFVIS